MKAEYKFGKNSGQTIFSVWFEMKVGIRKDKKLYFWLWENVDYSWPARLTNISWNYFISLYSIIRNMEF